VKATRIGRYIVAALLLAPVVPLRAAEAETLPDSQELLRALVDELARSRSLQMEDLEKPYFIQFSVDDSISYQMAAAYGDLTSSERDRSRDFRCNTRVGSNELDNTNFSGDRGGFAAFFGGGSGGRRASLPLDDDYQAIRQAIWWAVDQDYKDAVETLTKKRAYMKDKNLQDRPHDFAKASVVEHLEPTASLEFDRSAWEQKLRRISARFKKHPQIQDSNVRLFATVGNNYVVNTEGTRLRTADTGVLLIVTAELQAEDGMKVTDGRKYYGPTPQDLPPVEQIEADIDEMVVSMTRVAAAPVLERYTGPVLFDGEAAGQMFRTLIAEGIAGQVDPVGTQRSRQTGAGSLEKKLGQRVLPRTMQVHDDPTVRQVGGTHLLGHYRYDAEGVLAERVNLVVDGVLKNMVMSRAPTRELTGTNGHGRRAAGGGDISAAIGCLFIEDQEGLSDEELKARLIEAAREEGLEYGLRIGSVRSTGIGSTQSDLFAMFFRMQRRGGQQNVGDPIYACKVYVEDGREEPVRGCEFGQMKVRDLKHILAAGRTPAVYNYVGIGLGGATPATSIVAPGVLFEELELSEIRQEHDKRPILTTPLKR